MKINKQFPNLSLANISQDVQGKNIAIIGGTGGLGRAMAQRLSVNGAHVWAVGQTFRDSDKANLSFIKADLSLMSEAARVADALPAEKLDAVIFTAGIFASPERQETSEGIERDMAVSYLNRLLMLERMASRLGKETNAIPRVFVMAYPGSGQIGAIGDLNSENQYKAMDAHMNTVAGNEILVLNGALHYPNFNIFGLNPGLIKTNIRTNFLGEKKWLFNMLEGVIGLLSPTPEQYADNILPTMFAHDLDQHNGALFNRKGQALLPSEGIDSPNYMNSFVEQARVLIQKAMQTSDSNTPSEETHMTTVFTPTKLGRYTLANRLAMAPMTRSRAQFDGTPGENATEYYAQRASIGLIVSEGTQPSDDGQGYLTTPGIYTDAHVAGWSKVTQAVHDKGGVFFVQLMHAGRMSHPDNTPHHRQGVAPSAIAPNTPMFTMTGMQDIPTPRELTVEEIQQTVQDFRYSAKRAIEAGADGVEIHGANAYLIQQFFAPSSNTRNDQYGGSIENRARFAIEIVQAIVDEIGADRTAIRLSPGTTLWGIDEGEEGPDLYRYLVAELNRFGLAYLHIMHQGNEPLLNDIRQLWDSTLVLNRPGKTRTDIGSDIESGLADIEAYGQMVLANPDFVTRLKTGEPMNIADHTTYFGGTDKGYTDYPSLSQ
ncbi:oxidoreductase [Vibrio furnissii]|uniref:oxidoreductase n=1 Tax=Vibrio furnissii TaxID=29494 RepID=UPI0037504B89